MKRGEIYLTDFNPARGGEMGKLRPALIVSGEEEVTLLETVMVLPLSTVLLDNAFPYRFRLEPRAALEKPSDVCINEIRALSKSRLKEQIATVNETEYSQITKGLCALI